MEASVRFIGARGFGRRLPDKPPPWRDRVAAMRHVPAFLRLVWESHRGYAAAVAALRVVRAGVPVLTLWVGKLIIDAVVAAARAHVAPRDAHRLWHYVAIEIAIVLGGDLLARASGYAEASLGMLFANRMGVRIMEHAAALDLAQFEDPAFYDRLERARAQAGGAGMNVFGQTLGMGQSLLALGSLIAALAVFDWRLLLLLVAAIVPSFVSETWYAGKLYTLFVRRTAERRQLDYLRYVAASDRTAKEVQLFGLAPWLVRRFRALAERLLREDRALALNRSGVGAGLGALGTACYYGAYVLILARAVGGAISLGTLTFLTGSFARARAICCRGSSPA
ncbi:ABC transporter (plasmid) [Gemmatirosa kalamazoonensis]|uniref:ABC transporter n=1 Tax=Gemmatirosa kalamazoonensis TaxID=861299 RepID=W0RP61_9BACT|nr:ABC transporter [Gemmatirosa kalamazoonensis]